MLRGVDYTLGRVWTWLLDAKLMIASHCIWYIFSPYCKCWIVQPFKTSNDWFDVLTSCCEHNLLLAPICIYASLSQISKCWLITWWCWLWWKGMAATSLNVCSGTVHPLWWINFHKILIYTCVCLAKVWYLGSDHTRVFVLACKCFLQFKVRRKVEAALFPLLKSDSLICFQTHGSYYTRSWKMT